MNTSTIIKKLLTSLVTKSIFESVSLADQKKVMTNKTKYHTIFQPALILNALSDIDLPQSLSIKSDIAAFLIRQKSSDWSFNYWDKKTPEYHKFRIPNDLDDSAAAWSGLWRFDQSKFPPKTLAKITNVLINNEEQEGGPYRTWILFGCTDQKWLDVDPAVNAHLAYFLSLNDIELPNLTAFFEQIIHHKKYQSIYYPNDYATIYYLSRCYRGPLKEELVKDILQRKSNKNEWGNILHDSLMVTALHNLGLSPQIFRPIVAKWKQTVANEQNWLYPFCMDPVVNKIKHYAGSRALTMALAIETAGKILATETKKNVPPPKNSQQQLAKKYSQKIWRTAMQTANELNDPLRQKISECLKVMAKKDEDGEIVLLPWLLAQHCRFVDQHDILPQLSLANLWGWIAYTIYDDFLDEEGQPVNLPAANWSMLKLANIYQKIAALTNRPTINQKFMELMMEMENANLWEVQNCRFVDVISKADLPDFGDLRIIANKSIPHSMGPISIIKQTKDSTPKDVVHLEKFFRHYLLARQLHDDAHDWQDDLKKGQINAAGAMVLNDYFVQQKEWSVQSDTAPLQKIFWTKTVKKINRIVQKNIRAAKKHWQQVKIIHQGDFILRKLDNLSSAAHRAVHESKAAKEFIREFV